MTGDSRRSRILPRVWRAAWAAAWTVHAVRVVRREVVARPLDEVCAPRAPGWAARGGGRTVNRVLRVTGCSCLVSAFVRRSWREAAEGQRPAVVIGVSAVGAPLPAHAWLEGEAAPEYVELSRFG